MYVAKATPSPAPVKRRKFSAVLLNFVAGNPVRAFLACIFLFWVPLALTVINLRG